MKRKLLELTPSQKFLKILDGYFIAFCRRAFHWSPAYKEVLKNAEKEIGKFECKQCKSLVERSKKQVDHISPVRDVSEKWDRDWNKYRDRLFVGVNDLQVLCLDCHKKKSKKENEERK